VRFFRQSSHRNACDMLLLNVVVADPQFQNRLDTVSPTAIGEPHDSAREVPHHLWRAGDSKLADTLQKPLVRHPSLHNDWRGCQCPVPTMGQQNGCARPDNVPLSSEIPAPAPAPQSRTRSPAALTCENGALGATTSYLPGGPLSAAFAATASPSPSSASASGARGTIAPAAEPAAIGMTGPLAVPTWQTVVQQIPGKASSWAGPWRMLLGSAGRPAPLAMPSLLPLPAAPGAPPGASNPRGMSLGGPAISLALKSCTSVRQVEVRRSHLYGAAAAAAVVYGCL
jgi:hypothetical protein